MVVSPEGSRDRRISRATRILLIKSGRQRKIGKALTGGGWLIWTLPVLVLVVLFFVFATGALAFSDVPAGDPHAAAIEDLSSRGITNGFPDGSFGPTQAVTRQQFAKMIVYALGLPATTADVCRFSDVALSRGDDLYPDHFVAVAAANGITRGYADGTFGPYNAIERVHAVTMLIRALERIYPAALDVPPQGSPFEGDWGDLYGEQRDHAALALSNGLLDGLDVSGVARDPRTPMLRGEVAQVLSNMMRLLPEVAKFQSSIQQLDDSLEASMLASGSWSAAAPVSMEELRTLRVSFWGFDGRTHTGGVVVRGVWADDLQTVFQKLYDARFPIRSMNLIDDYGASDERSMAADNTSAYNGRYVGGTTVWSMHAYGLAIDINPIENPWVSAGDVSPAAGRSFVNRSLNAPGMIHSWDVVVRAFTSIGWKWGGDWKGTKDYQHFSSNGK